MFATEKITSLERQHAKLVNEARQILDKQEGRSSGTLDESEARAYDEIMGRLKVTNEALEQAREERAKELGEQRAAALNGRRTVSDQSYQHGEQRGSGILPSLSEYRALSEGTASAGGYFVPDQQARTFFDRLRAESVVLAANPRIFEGVNDVLLIPKIGASVTAGMFAENAEITASDLTAEQVALTFRKAAALSRASNEVLADSNPAIREVLEYDLRRTLGALIDQQFLSGNGTAPNLRGIRNFTGVTATSLGVNGATPTLDDIANAIQRAEQNNSKPDAIFMHPRTWAVFREVKDTQTRYQLSPDPTQDARKQLFGVPVYLSSQIAINETVGTSTDCSWIAVAQMDQIAVGRRQDINVAYSESRYFEFDQTAVRVTARFAIAPINEEGIELITGVRG